MASKKKNAMADDYRRALAELEAAKKDLQKVQQARQAAVDNLTSAKKSAESARYVHIDSLLHT